MKGQPPAGGDTNWAEGDFVASFDEAAAATVACFEEDGALQQMVASRQTLRQNSPQASWRRRVR